MFALSNVTHTVGILSLKLTNLSLTLTSKNFFSDFVLLSEK